MQGAPGCVEGVLHSVCGVLGLNPGLATLGLGTSPAELSCSQTRWGVGRSGPRVHTQVKT